jgi:hypothetical protein
MSCFDVMGHKLNPGPNSLPNASDLVLFFLFSLNQHFFVRQESPYDPSIFVGQGNCGNIPVSPCNQSFEPCFLSLACLLLVNDRCLLAPWAARCFVPV